MAVHTVEVEDRPHKITVHQKSKNLWIAIGEYMGERLAVQDQSEATAIKCWCEAARYKGTTDRARL
jgi:hypothetical protein